MQKLGYHCLLLELVIKSPEDIAPDFPEIDAVVLDGI